MKSLPSDLQELLEKAETLKQEGQHKEAIKLLESLLLSYLEVGEIYEEIGDNYLSLDEVEKAIKALKMAVKCNPHSANAHYLLGFAYSIIGAWNTSFTYLRKADTLQPNHPEILRCLGWTLFNMNKRKQGISLLERAQALNPTDVNILYDLGLCYLNSLQISKAESTFQQILLLQPDFLQARECLKLIQNFKKAEKEPKKLPKKK